MVSCLNTRSSAFAGSETVAALNLIMATPDEAVAIDWCMALIRMASRVLKRLDDGIFG